MKQGKVGVTQVAGIILIFLVLVILVISLTGLYGQTFEDSIKHIFGIQTDAEEYHETNVKSETYFENLLIDIKKCQDSKKNNCGCELDLSGFSPNQIIRTKEEQTELLDIGSVSDINILDKDGSLLKKSTEIKEIDCMYDKNTNLIDDKIMTIFFHEDVPLISYMDSNFWDQVTFFFNKKGFHRAKKDMDDNFQLYKSNGKICWLQEIKESIPNCD